MTVGERGTRQACTVTVTREWLWIQIEYQASLHGMISSHHACTALHNWHLGL